MDMVKYLLSHEADYLAHNLDYSTPFHVAAVNGKHEVCRLLWELGFEELFSMDGEGRTPIDLALESGFRDLASKIAMWHSIDLLTQVRRASIMALCW